MGYYWNISKNGIHLFVYDNGEIMIVRENKDPIVFDSIDDILLTMDEEKTELYSRRSDYYP